MSAARGVAALPWALALALAGICVVAEDPDYHAILGLGPDAKQLDATLAYINLTKGLGREARPGSEERLRFVEVQRAFEALADDQMKQEALEALEYSDHVRLLRDDAELQFFTQLQTGGSSHLRVVFLLESRDERLWQVFATATQLSGNAKVAQLYHRDASDSSGKPGPFLSTLRVRSYPAALIYDPLSRAMTVSSGLDGVRGEVQKFLDGRLDPSEKLARVQELDRESYRTRCSASVSWRSEECQWIFVLATTAAAEANLPTLSTTLSTFAESCRTFHVQNYDAYPSVGCFWLRLDRSPDWAQLLQRQGMPEGKEAAVVAVSLRSGALILAQTALETMTSQAALWFRDVLKQEPRPTAQPLPPLPWPMSAEEEPSEGPLVQASRLAQQLLDSLEQKAGPWLQSAIRDYRRMNNEDKLLVIGAGICGILLLLYGLRTCCCGGRNRGLTEEQVMKALVPIVPVQLSRQDGERLGMSISAGERNCLVVTGVSKGDVIDRHNNAETHLGRRVLEGDRVVFAEAPGGARAAAFGEISALLKANQTVTLGLATTRSESLMQRSIFMVKLQDVNLTEADLRAPTLSWGGSADAKGAELATLGPALTAWNSARRQEGLDCTQMLQVGDRIISTNGQTDVRAQLARTPSPLLLVARWWPVGALDTDRFEATVEKSGPEDRLGMHLRVIVGQPHYQVVEVFPTGAVARRNAAGGRQILPGDRIVCINGAKDTKGMEQELVKAKVELTLERWVDKGGGGMVAQAAPAMAAAPPPVKAQAATSAPTAAAAPPASKASSSGRSSCSALHCLVGPLGLLICLGLCYEDVAKIGVQRCLRGELMDPERYVRLATAALGTGIVLVLHFLWYELTMLGQPRERGTWSQLINAAVASTCLGYGHWFLHTWAFAM